MLFAEVAVNFSGFFCPDPGLPLFVVKSIAWRPAYDGNNVLLITLFIATQQFVNITKTFRNFKLRQLVQSHIKEKYTMTTLASAFSDSVVNEDSEPSG